jgi:hypothetical protein
LERHAERLRRCLALPPEEGFRHTARIPKDGHAGELGDGLLEELQMFPRDLRTGRIRHPGEVAAGPGEARHQPALHGVGDIHHDDGKCAGGLLGRTDLGGPIGNKEIHLETHQLRREGRGTLLPPPRPPTLDHEVLARDVPALPQSLHPCLPERSAHYWATLGVGLMTRSRDREISYPIDLPRLLRVGGQWRREETEGERDDEHTSAGLHGDLLCFLTGC